MQENFLNVACNLKPVKDMSRLRKSISLDFDKSGDKSKVKTSFPLFFFFVLIFSVLWITPDIGVAETFTEVDGGQCVEYACNKYPVEENNCPTVGSAYKIFGSWDYGFGDGPDPAENSLIILNPTTKNLYGHVGIVRGVIPLADGKYELRGR